MIYIECDNIDLVPSNNKVFVGDYPCVIPDNGVNDKYLSCETTKPTGAALSNLSVRIELVKRPPPEA